MGYLKVTAEELVSVAGQLGTAAASIQQENSSAMSQVNGLVGAGWEGAASQQFNTLFAQWKQGADQVQEALHGIGQLLSSAGQAYQQTEDQVRSSMGN